MIDTGKYDVIRGYRADDSYFTFAQEFVAGTISLRMLEHAMHLGDLGEQIVLKSRKAFTRIAYIDNEFADSTVHYPKKAARDLDAQRSYRTAKKELNRLDDIYILDIMREGMKHGDPRLQ